MENTTRPQKETWKVFGSDEVLEDKDLIEYYKLHQYDEKLFFELLGEFTSDGKYALPEDIKKTLVGVKKLVTHAGENSYFAETEIKTQTLRFAVRYWFADDKAIANLYFIENFYGEDMQTFVAQYVGENNESFLVKVKAVFNLTNEYNELEDECLDEIEKQYEFLAEKRAERDFVVELQSQLYVQEFLEILKQKCGDKGKKIAKEVETDLEEKKQLISKEGMYTAAKLKIDRLIIKEGGFGALKQTLPTLPKVVQTYTKPVKDYDDITKKLDSMKQPSGVAPAKKPSASKGGKSNSKKSGAKKSGGKKAGGDKKKSGGKGSGGKDKKKSDKKDVMLGYKPKPILLELEIEPKKINDKLGKVVQHKQDEKGKSEKIMPQKSKDKESKSEKAEQPKQNTDKSAGKSETGKKSEPNEKEKHDAAPISAPENVEEKPSEEAEKPKRTINLNPMKGMFKLGGLGKGAQVVINGGHLEESVNMLSEMPKREGPIVTDVANIEDDHRGVFDENKRPRERGEEIIIGSN